jgi:DNA polymerase IV
VAGELSFARPGYQCSNIGRSVPSGVRGKTLTLKVKYANFQQVTRSRTSEAPLSMQETLEQISFDLLNVIFPSPKGVRLLGVSLSSLANADVIEKHQLLLSL